MFGLCEGEDSTSSTKLGRELRRRVEQADHSVWNSRGLQALNIVNFSVRGFTSKEVNFRKRLWGRIICKNFECILEATVHLELL
jgi:hypothetical protein